MCNVGDFVEIVEPGAQNTYWRSEFEIPEPPEWAKSRRLIDKHWKEMGGYKGKIVTKLGTRCVIKLDDNFLGISYALFSEHGLEKITVEFFEESLFILE